MSTPRLIVPGVTYKLTRRCSARLFLLRPSRKINQIFEFCLAHAAKRAGVLIHGYCAMSNHYHVDATDVLGRLPEFMHWLDEYLAKCVNAELGRWESFWAPGSYSAVALMDEEAVMDALVYTYTNPVAAGLVRSHKQWPGAISRPDETDGAAKIIDRPTGFFRKNGRVPETATLSLVRPPVFSGDRSEWLRNLKKRIATREGEIQADFEKKGRDFVGRRGVLKQSPKAKPRTAAPRRGLSPRVATRDKWKRIETLQRLKAFLEEYRAAWLAFADGDRSAVFPHGTYAMCVRYGVPCAGP